MANDRDEEAVPPNLDEPPDLDKIDLPAFAYVRRGYDPDQVVAHIAVLAGQVASLRDYAAELEDRERSLQASLSEASRASDILTNRLDAEVTELAARETEQLLVSARALAGETRARAEADAVAVMAATKQKAKAMWIETKRRCQERLAEVEDALSARKVELDDLTIEVAELSGEVRRLQAEAESRGEAVLQEAREDAEGVAAEAELVIDRARRTADEILDQARIEAHELVAEAQADGQELIDEAREMRERLLGDITRRRSTLREQVEQLQAGRDRLLVAYEVVRQTWETAVVELDLVLPEAREAAQAAVGRLLAQGSDDDALARALTHRRRELAPDADDDPEAGSRPVFLFEDDAVVGEEDPVDPGFLEPTGQAVQAAASSPHAAPLGPGGRRGRGSGRETPGPAPVPPRVPARLAPDAVAGRWSSAVRVIPPPSGAGGGTADGPAVGPGDEPAPEVEPVAASGTLDDVITAQDFGTRVAEQPVDEQPVDEQPVNEQPLDEPPRRDDRSVTEPEPEEPTAEPTAEPAAEPTAEPAAEEPAAEEPAAEEPAAAESFVEEAAADGSVRVIHRPEVTGPVTEPEPVEQGEPAEPSEPSPTLFEVGPPQSPASEPAEQPVSAHGRVAPPDRSVSREPSSSSPSASWRPPFLHHPLAGTRPDDAPGDVDDRHPWWMAAQRTPEGGPGGLSTIDLVAALVQGAPPADPDGAGHLPQDPVEAARARCDAAVADARRSLRRRLKATLADDQNRALDALQRVTVGVPAANEVLPDEPTHRSRFVEAARAGLLLAAATGRELAADLALDEARRSYPSSPAAGLTVDIGPPLIADDLATWLADELLDLLRTRLLMCFPEVAMVSENPRLDRARRDEVQWALRAAYRRVKGAKVDALIERASGEAVYRSVRDHLPAGLRPAGIEPQELFRAG